MTNFAGEPTTDGGKPSHMGGTSRDVLFPPLSRPTAPEVLDTSTMSNWPGGLAAPDGFDVNGRPPPGERLREKPPRLKKNLSYSSILCLPSCPSSSSFSCSIEGHYLGSSLPHVCPTPPCRSNSTLLLSPWHADALPPLPPRKCSPEVTLETLRQAPFLLPTTPLQVQ